jgi:hypothetical protein
VHTGWLRGINLVGPRKQKVFAVRCADFAMYITEVVGAQGLEPWTR